MKCWRDTHVSGVAVLSIGLKQTILYDQDEGDTNQGKHSFQFPILMLQHIMTFYTIICSQLSDSLGESFFLFQ